VECRSSGTGGDAQGCTEGVEAGMMDIGMSTMSLLDAMQFYRAGIIAGAVLFIAISVWHAGGGRRWKG